MSDSFFFYGNVALILVMLAATIFFGVWGHRRNQPKWVTRNEDKPLTPDERVSITIAAQRLLGHQQEMTREREVKLVNALLDILSERVDAE